MRRAHASSTGDREATPCARLFRCVRTPLCSSDDAILGRGKIQGGGTDLDSWTGFRGWGVEESDRGDAIDTIATGSNPSPTDQPRRKAPTPPPTTRPWSKSSLRRGTRRTDEH